MIKTDLNTRERAHYAELFRKNAELVNEIAECIEKEDDEKMIMKFTMFMLMNLSMREFVEIVEQAISASNNEPEFPSIIGG